jgi:hypothetical protein
MRDYDDKKRMTPVFDDNTYWGHRKFEFDGVEILYMGRHKTYGASTALEDWCIWQYTFVDGNLTDIGELWGAWDDRAALNW